MLYNKAMIDLVNEARRRVPSEHKPAVKLANPEVFQELHTIYQKSHDTILKIIIKELFVLAGEPWSLLLEKKDSEVEARHVVKSYRGVMQLLEVNRSGGTDRARAKQRIYRGQLVPE